LPNTDAAIFRHVVFPEELLPTRWNPQLETPQIFKIILANATLTTNISLELLIVICTDIDKGSRVD
jgi:hypothetical protein